MSNTPNSPYEKPKPPSKDKIIDGEKIQETVEDIKETAQQALRNPQGPEAQQVIEQSRSFVERNKKTILITVGVLVVLRVNKRRISKHTAKQVIKALEKSEVGRNLPVGMSKGSVQTAADIMQDDHFELGGQLYRVIEKVTNDFGEPVIKFLNTANGRMGGLAIMSPAATIETFNQ